MAREQVSIVAYIHQYLEPAIQCDNDERARLRRSLDGLIDAHNQLLRAHEGLQKAYSAQERRLAKVEDTLDEAMSLMKSIDTRFTGFAAAHTRDNHPNLQTESDNRHHDLAGEYTRFLDGEVFPLVLAPTVNGSILPADRQAHAFSAVSQVLFESPDPTPEAVQAALATYQLDHPVGELADVCRHAVAIRSEAADLGRHHKWDFEPGDGPFDQAKQERIAGSANGEMVTCVVAPGYVVGDGQVIVRQRVLTGLTAPQQAGLVPRTEHAQQPPADRRVEEPR
jgi:hypothetical protein